MLHVGLDLSRRKVDVCLLSDEGEHLDQLAVPPDVDSLKTLARRIEEVHHQPVCAVVESMTGARLVHDTLEQEGWAVEIADAQKVKGLAPLACKTDRIDSMVLAVLSQRDLVPAIWLPDPSVREERELARFRLHLVKHRSDRKPLTQAPNRNARHFAGRLGVQGGEICVFCFWEVGRTLDQAPRATLNRVEAVSVTWAAPTPTRKTAAYHSPVARPTTRPPITAAAASR
jgi:Transposase